MRQKWAVVVVTLGFVLCGAWARAQQPSEHEQHQAGGAPAPKPSMMKGGMGEKCAMMQKGMDEMDGKMREAHAKLNRLVHEMNTTTGPAKMDAMAAVTNEAAAHSEAMHRMHTGMMQKMMTHMTEHMMQGMGPQGQKPEMKEMMMCPMMQGHGEGEHGKAGASPDEHKDHPAPAPDAPKDGGASDEHEGHHPPAE